MKVVAETQIKAPVNKVWRVVMNISNSHKYIKGIDKIVVLDQPESGMVGFKWKEERTMMGKTATEVMWITEVEENSHYKVRAESNGYVYQSNISLEAQNGGTLLKMEFGGTPQNFRAKIFGLLMAPLFKGASRKMIQEDINDIRDYVESKKRY